MGRAGESSFLQLLNNEQGRRRGEGGLRREERLGISEADYSYSRARDGQEGEGGKKGEKGTKGG